MTEKVENLLSHMFRTARENQVFLDHKAESLVKEAVRLANDSIDRVFAFVRTSDAADFQARQAMAFYVHHVMMPISYSVFLNLMTGNLPACFRELRFMLESLAKCYLADLRYPESDFYQKKLESLENEKGKKGRGGRKPEREFMEEMDRELNSDERFIRLWGKLSAEVHLKRYMERVLSNIVRESLPPYALVIPVNYEEDDVEDLKELDDYISELREIMGMVMKSYGTAFNIEQLR